jgi:hypothetical protein
MWARLEPEQITHNHPEEIKSIQKQNFLFLFFFVSIFLLTISTKLSLIVLIGLTEWAQRKEERVQIRIPFFSGTSEDPRVGIVLYENALQSLDDTFEMSKYLYIVYPERSSY